MRLVAIAIVTILCTHSVRAEPPAPRDPTEELFSRKCSSCHTIGKGKRVGPDLSGVDKRRDAAWLTRFIATPSGMLDSDADARALLKEYNGLRMPDLGLSAEQASAMVALIARCSGEVCDLAPSFTPATTATEADFARGRALFDGTERTKSGGPPCVACHTTSNLGGGIHEGGTLAKDLSHAFARLGDEGMDAALRSPPFAVMNKVFDDHPLESDEVFAIRAFLYDANRFSGAHGGGTPFQLAGLLIALVTLLGLNAAWSRRLRGVRRSLVQKREPPA